MKVLTSISCLKRNFRLHEQKEGEKTENLFLCQMLYIYIIGFGEITVLIQQSHWSQLALLQKLVNVIASAINEKSLPKKMDSDLFPVCGC